MYYLITDDSGASWRGVRWGPGVTHTADGNANYFFTVYRSPLVAAYMYPWAGQITGPRLWRASATGLDGGYGYCGHADTVTCEGEEPACFPTGEQHLTFGVLAAMNVVRDGSFREWAVGWLRGADRSPETAARVADGLAAKLFNEEDVAAGLAALSAVWGAADPLVSSAAAGHRAYTDHGLDIEGVAQIVSAVPPAQIAEVMA